MYPIGDAKSLQRVSPQTFGGADNQVYAVAHIAFIEV